MGSPTITMRGNIAKAVVTVGVDAATDVGAVTELYSVALEALFTEPAALVAWIKYAYEWLVVGPVQVYDVVVAATVPIDTQLAPSIE